jgi:hypothetical protein
MYGSWILYLLNKKIYLVIPILGMIADWSENFSELLMIQSYVTSGSITQSLVSVGSGDKLLQMDYVEPNLSASHHWNNRCDKIIFNEKKI